jgi:hypothetical protein
MFVLSVTIIEISSMFREHCVIIEIDRVNFVKSLFRYHVKLVVVLIDRSYTMGHIKLFYKKCLNKYETKQFSRVLFLVLLLLFYKIINIFIVLKIETERKRGK